MQIKKSVLTCSGLMALVLGGCATANPALEGSLSSGFGDAVIANMNAHAVAPSAQQKANTYIPADPSRAALARKNYRENTVADPEPVSVAGDR